MPWQGVKEAEVAIDLIASGSPEQGVKMLHGSLFVDLGWQDDRESWSQAVVALGRVHDLLFEKEFEVTMLSMWCVVAASEQATKDDLEYIVDKLFIDGSKFQTDSCTAEIKSCKLKRIPGVNSFKTLKDVMENTDSRGSVDETLLLTKILANHGGAPYVIAEGVEGLIIHASAPLCPVAVTTESESIPITDENNVSDGVIMWSDAKISSAQYIQSCWREAAVDACCSVLEVLNEYEAEEFANDWGRQLSIDSTSEHTISILNAVSGLPHSYLITSTLLPPILTKARFVHKNSVLTFLVTDHPEYLSRRWFLEAILPVERGTFSHLLLTLYENISTCLDPCWRTELIKILSVLMGWSQPCRVSDSEAASPELLQEISSRAQEVEYRTPVCQIKNPDVLKTVLELSILRDNENKYSLAQRWANALVSLLESPEVAPYLKEEGLGVGPLIMGHIPNKGDIMVDGLYRVLSRCPETEAVLKIWEACFPCHELGPWMDLNHKTNLVQTTAAKVFDFRIGWVCRDFEGDTSSVKNKCFTSTFIRHLFAVFSSLQRCGYAILVGPSSHKSALGECYATIANKTVLQVPQREIWNVEAWLKGEAKDSKYEEYNFEDLMLHLDGGTLPTVDLLEAAKSKGVVVVSSLTPKQYKLCEGTLDAMWCCVLPVEEVSEVLEWVMRNMPLSEVDQVVSFLTQYYSATGRTTTPQTLGGMTEIAKKIAAAEQGEELNTCVFEVVGWYGVLQEEQDRAIVRAGLRRKNCILSTKFEEAAKDPDPETEVRMQALISRVSQNKMQTFVKDKFAIGKTKFAAWKANTRWANKSSPKK